MHPCRPSVVAVLLMAALAAALAGQSPTSRPTSPSGAPVPGVGPVQPTPRPSPAATPGTGTGIIRGRVVRADTGQPLRKAFVSVTNQGNIRDELVATTDGEGRYELKGLPAGQYVPAASKSGFVGLQYGQRYPGEAARSLQLGDGQAIDTIDFALGPGGVIAGRVVDEAGEPLAGMVVEAMTPRYAQGVRQLTAADTRDVTDDLGRFRLFGLAPGRWGVRATSPDRAPQLSALRTAPSMGTVTYYPSTRAAADAQAVQVNAGSEVTGLTITVVPTRLAAIVGMVRTSDGGVPSSRTSLFIVPVRDSGAITGGDLIRPDGSFAIPNLPPGRYLIGVRLGGAQGAVTEVELDGADASVALTLHRGSSASGRFTFDTDVPPPTLPSKAVRVRAEPLPVLLLSAGTAPPLVIVRNDWTFEIQDLIGPQQLHVTLPEGWAVDSIRLGGKDVTSQRFDVGDKDIDGIVVHLTQRISAVRGQVSDQRGQRVTRATVVLFADDRTKWTPGTRFVRAARVDADGRFDVRGLPAARYMAVALEFLEPGEETNPETLEQLERLGTPLTLDDGGTAMVSLKVSPAP
jgi:hypothetical protein